MRWILLFILTLHFMTLDCDGAERKPLKPIKRTVVVDAGDGTEITWNGAGWSQK